MKQLYHNYEGYSPDANRISSMIADYVKDLMEDYPEYSALEIAALAHGAVEEAFCEVSLDRRFGK